jgi:hypothetical protein
MSPAIGLTGLAVAAVLLVASLGTVITTGPLAAGSVVTIVALALFVAWFFWISLVLLARPQPAPRSEASPT